MGFYYEYIKRSRYGDLTGPARNFQQSVAYDAADRENMPHISYAGSSDYTPTGIDIDFRFSKRGILRSIIFGTIGLLTGLLLGEFFGGIIVGKMGVGVAILSGILLLSALFRIFVNILFSSLCGIAHLTSQIWLRRAVKAGFWSGLALTIATQSMSGLLYGFVTGAFIALVYTFLKRPKKT